MFELASKNNVGLDQGWESFLGRISKPAVKSGMQTDLILIKNAFIRGVILLRYMQCSDDGSKQQFQTDKKMLEKFIESPPSVKKAKAGVGEGGAGRASSFSPSTSPSSSEGSFGSSSSASSDKGSSRGSSRSFARKKGARGAEAAGRAFYQ